MAHLNKKNIKGCILDYWIICVSTEPKALRELQQFANLEIRIYTQGNFHTKGYIFRHADYYSLIIGSSNLTQGALKANKEWNLKVSSTEQEAICRDTLQEFRRMWENAVPLTDEWLRGYEKHYQQKQKISPVKQPFPAKFAPNKNADGSARFTGKTAPIGTDESGCSSPPPARAKTYLAAFAVQKSAPRRVLFLSTSRTDFKAGCADFSTCSRQYRYRFFIGNA